MSARKIQDENDAKACIAKIKESGLALSAWARLAGVNGRSLHAWIMPARPLCRPRRRASSTWAYSMTRSRTYKMRFLTKHSNYGDDGSEAECGAMLGR